jgi:hypothetical protein
MSVSEIRKLMGTIVDPLWRSHSGVKKELSFLSQKLPETFDSREKWPYCAEIIGHVRD